MSWAMLCTQKSQKVDVAILTSENFPGDSESLNPREWGRGQAWRTEFKPPASTWKLFAPAYTLNPNTEKVGMESSPELAG